MAKINKDEEARRAGIAYAYKIILDAKNNGADDSAAVEALRKEIRFRNITKAPLAIPKAQVDDFCEDVKHNCVTTFKLMTMMTLHDEFGFGKRRLEQFMERFMLKVECINEDYASWQDYQDIIKDECGILVDLEKEFLEMAHKKKEE